MNKYMRSAALGLTLGLMPACEIAENTAKPAAETFELQRFVDPDSDVNGIGKVVCEVAIREPIYRILFDRKDALSQLRAVTGVPEATLGTAIEAGVTCREPLRTSDIEKGLGVVVMGTIIDPAHKRHEIHEVCLVAGYSVTGEPTNEHTKLSAFCPDRSVGHI